MSNINLIHHDQVREGEPEEQDSQVSHVEGYGNTGQSCNPIRIQ